MKNFLIVIFGMLINALYMYVVLPIIIVGITAWLWVPLLFEGAVVIGIAISVLTLVIVGIVDYKLEND